MKEKPFKIERGIPIPSKHKNRGSKYPFASMKIGDSFFVPSLNGWGGLQSRLYAIAKKAGSTICTRKVDGGIRIWKVK